MAAEERPAKVRKLDHGDVSESPTTDAFMENEDMMDVPKNAGNNAGPRDSNGKSKDQPKAPLRLMSGAIQLDMDEELNEDGEPVGKMSKTQLKRLMKKKMWDESRGFRKAERKEKKKAQKERKREERKKARENGDVEKLSELPQVHARGSARWLHQRRNATQLPVTFVYDCSWNELMTDKEIVSLANQITRCYSDNAKAAFRAHLVVSSYGGSLKERYNNALHGNHENWKGFRFREEGLVEVSKLAEKWMSAEEDGGKLEGPFEGMNEQDARKMTEIIYLSSDSDYTLTELNPYSIYVIGGLVDKNRHKGVCFKKASDLGLKTAKLPIGQYLQMASRKVLTVNHVSEIMLKWLEHKDWAKAFNEVMPKRKGGVLIKQDAEDDISIIDGAEADDEDIDIITEQVSAEAEESS